MLAAVAAPLMVVNASAIESDRLKQALSDIAPLSTTKAAENLGEIDEAPEEAKEETVEQKPKTWQADGLSPNEAKALAYFQERGITDKVALATIMGNIQQESRFHSNICEGGARVQYENCWTGGYGLIQWTTVGRYDGLGRHAKNIGGNASTIDTQLSYIFTEREWKEAEWRFKTPGKDISFYMKGAYRWLGWGIYGNRGFYTQQYLKIMELR